MQTIYLDISNKGVLPTIYAKQGDVGRRFLVVLTDSGIPYTLPAGSVFSVWYEGDSGEGNYTDIGGHSAFNVSANSVEVELIVQMLSVPGNGLICLMLSGNDGKQIGSWNIPYVCEEVPGLGSKTATEYYTAFSKALDDLRGVSKEFTPEAIGAAPAGYGLGENAEENQDADSLTGTGFYSCATNSPDGEWWYGFHIRYGDGYAYQRMTKTYGSIVAERSQIAGTWQPWEWVNPPMGLGVEYRTTERYDGKPVYAKLIYFGSLPANTSGHIAHGISGVDKIVSCDLSFFDNADTYSAPYFSGGTVKVSAQANTTYVTVGTTADYSAYTGVVTLKCTKK